MKQLSLQEKTTITSAQLSAISTSRKRRASKWVLEIINSLWWFCYSSDVSVQCEGYVVTTGNLFIISFTIEYSHGCNYPSCEEKFIKEVESQIAAVPANLTLTLPLANGTTIEIDASFCSINQTNSSECIFHLWNQNTLDLWIIQST
jgi:hypothetical protein